MKVYKITNANGRTRIVERDDERKNVATLTAERDRWKAIASAARPVLESTVEYLGDGPGIASDARHVLAMYPEAK